MKVYMPFYEKPEDWPEANLRDYTHGDELFYYPAYLMDKSHPFRVYSSIDALFRCLEQRIYEDGSVAVYAAHVENDDVVENADTFEVITVHVSGLAGEFSAADVAKRLHG